jgi:hypothetical protein
VPGRSGDQEAYEGIRLKGGSVAGGRGWWARAVGEGRGSGRGEGWWERDGGAEGVRVPKGGDAIVAGRGDAPHASVRAASIGGQGPAPSLLRVIHIGIRTWLDQSPALARSQGKW